MISLIHGISTFVGYLLSKLSFYQNNSDSILYIAVVDKGVYIIPKLFSSKSNVIAWMELELTVYDSAV